MRDQISEFGLVAAAAGRRVRIAAAAAGVGAKAVGRRTGGKGVSVVNFIVNFTDVWLSSYFVPWLYPHEYSSSSSSLQRDPLSFSL